MNILLAVNSSYAEEEKARVIEEELVLKDPTVAHTGKWVVGAGYDYWYVSGPYNRYDGSTKTATGTIDGSMNGGNFFIGYDKFTLQFTTRSGAWDVKMRFLSQPVNDTDRQEQTENEITLRYLISTKYWANPYIIVGYNDIMVKSTDTITTPGFVWSYNGKTVSRHDSTFKSGLAGIGLIIPFNRYLGIRGDGRLMFTSAENKRDDGRVWTGSGIGGAGTLTGYWNIYKGLNLQVGGKFLYLAGGDAGWYTKGGYFASLGYNYKF